MILTNNDIFIVWWFKQLASSKSGSILLSILLIIVTIIFGIIEIKHYFALFKIEKHLANIEKLLNKNIKSAADDEI